MRSHTVPRKLLEQFAYADARTNSKRLWAYSKGVAPRGGVSPKTATRIENHFVDPADEEREAKVERRLNEEFEDPVHKFIDQLQYRTFVLSRTHVRFLTRYISLLFHRSQARRGATKQQVAIILESAKALLADEDKLSKIAGRWTLEMIRQGIASSRPVNVDDVRRALEGLLQAIAMPDHEQTTYVNTIEHMMSSLDEAMDNGAWNPLHTTLEEPFVIGDAPVVTWERDERNFLIYGQGFSRPNVEVLLPVAPTACLHILPAVPRSRNVVIPKVDEVNAAQAAFATHHCYAHCNSAGIDAILQPIFGTTKIGINAFSVRHRNYTDTMFHLLMSGGRDF